MQRRSGVKTVYFICRVCLKEREEGALMKILRMRSWNFHAEDFNAMSRFYHEGLGLEIRKTHSVAGVKVIRLGAGDTGLGLFDAAEKRAPRVPHHTFDIEGPDDPNELARELETKGLKVDDIRLHDGSRGYSVYVIDPGGNRLELSRDG
jgi:predicted enzyme related to lactoylglutathione lyase